MSERREFEAPPPMEEIEEVHTWAQEKVTSGDPNEIDKYQKVVDSLDAIINEAALDEAETPVTYGRERGGEG